MTKEIKKDVLKSYLHFYLNRVKCLYRVTPEDKNPYINELTPAEYERHLNGHHDNAAEYRPILVPITKLTEDEFIELCGMNDIKKDGFSIYEMNSFQFKYLLNKGYDLFNLIEHGLAIDGSKRKKK